MRVVIPIVAGVGNALLAVPMVRQLKRHHPEAKITIIARIDAMAEVFRRLPEVDETIVARSPSDSVKATRARRPELYIVPFPSNRWQYSLLQFASGARRRLIHDYPVGYWRAMHFLPGERVPAVRRIHDVVQNLNLLRRLGIIPDETDAPTFAVNDADRKRANKLLSGVSGKFIAVHAGSAKTILAKAKRWPTEKYAELIGRLNDQVVLLEGPDEDGVAAEILGHLTPSPGTPGEGGGEGDFEMRKSFDAANHPHPNPLPEYRESGADAQVNVRREAGAARVRSAPACIRLTGGLGDAAGVLERATMYVGSDSGLAHLAAAVGTPAVTLFAPADPDRVCPFGYRHLVVQPPPPCAPCFLYPWKKPFPAMDCVDPRCIEKISVEMVLEKIAGAS